MVLKNKNKKSEDLRIRKYTNNPNRKFQEDHRDQFGLERLIFFSDAVFAIAITLLALEIQLPDADHLLNDQELFSQLIGMWHEYLAYCISFLVIGTFWIAHHRKFRLIKEYDSRLLSLNLLFLMIIAFIPFPTSIISKYPYRSATIFYAITMLLAGLLMTGIWWYASTKIHLIDPNLDDRQKRRQFIAPLVTSGIFFLSICVSFWDQGFARFIWLLILFSAWYANKS